MIAKWKSMDIYDDLPYLVVENGPLMAEIVISSKHQLKGKGVLIIGIDGPNILKKKEQKAFCDQLNSIEIPFYVVGSFVWVEPQNIEKLFKESDFGRSGDTCFFLDKKPDDINITVIPRLKGILKKRFSEELIDIIEKAGAGAIYFTNDIPDMLIVTKNESYLNYLNERIEILND